ncbi:MAG: undecaprenyl-diphosphate phosphatase [Clostridia bacterium]|nr:undecaprenyl-diphosphate phosphatase [Clostridia bacterium]
MQIWQAIVLGAVQGFAEFLPVSSSGHLILIQRWLGVNENGGGLFFDVMLHVGTLIPVFIVFFNEILGLFKRPKAVEVLDSNGKSVKKRPLFNPKLIYLIIATIPAGLTGMLLAEHVEGAFYSGDNLSAILLSITFILTAGELFVSEWISKKYKKALPLSYKNTLVMGLAQGVAIVPGLSRSGTVISSGCFMGVERSQNANFTFLMSIPVILGAALVSGLDLLEAGITVEILPLLFGILTAAITGYIAIKVMLKVIKKANYKWFSLYLILISIASIVSKLVFGI